MKWIADNLWELLRPTRPAAPPARSKAPRRPGPTPPARDRAATPMQRRYDELVEQMKRTHGLRVRKWRGSTSGCAWMVWYADGTTSRLIEAPYPRGPMSCAVFLHEVGHHAIGLGTYRPRCLEEYHAWRWSLDTMRELNFNVTPAVERRMREAVKYAIAKAMRRGLKRLPVELAEYVGAEEIRS